MKLVVTSGEHPTLDIRKIPEHEMDNFARATLRAVERYFKTPGAQEEYEKWLIEYEKREGSTMNISKGDKLYTIKECKNHWSVSDETTGVSVCFKVDKELCETEAELNEYIKNNDMF